MTNSNLDKTIDAAAEMMRLGYEQERFLFILKNKPDTEGSILCRDAGCSWDEMYSLAGMGLIKIGAERLQPKTVHPELTEIGRRFAERLEVKHKEQEETNGSN